MTHDTAILLSAVDDNVTKQRLGGINFVKRPKVNQ